MCQMNFTQGILTWVDGVADDGVFGAKAGCNVKGALRTDRYGREVIQIKSELKSDIKVHGRGTRLSLFIHPIYRYQFN